MNPENPITPFDPTAGDTSDVSAKPMPGESTPSIAPGSEPVVLPPQMAGADTTPNLPTPPAPTGKNPRILLIIIILVVLLAGGGAAAYFLAKQDKTAPTTTNGTDSSQDGENNQNTNTKLQNAENDTIRETSIKAIQGQVEAHYAINGYYPALDDINDPNYRQEHMKGLDEVLLQDPEDTSPTKALSATPGPKKYAYQVTPAECDNTTAAKSCTSYTLTATLSNGETYTKKALN